MNQYSLFPTNISLASFICQHLGVLEYSDEPHGMMRDREIQFDTSMFKENLTVKSPLSDGLISDVDLYEKIWEYAVTNFLKVDMKETPVLAAEKSYTSSSSRQR